MCPACRGCPGRGGALDADGTLGKNKWRRFPRWWVDTLGPTWVNMGKRATRYGKAMKPKWKIYKWWVSMVFYT
jgi:hypothetical protein